MDRIESLDGSYLSRRSRRKREKSTQKLKGRKFASVVEQSSGGGSALFDTAAHGEHGENLEELLDEVHQSGEKLIDSQSLENIGRYRQSVRSFLDYVVAHMVDVEEHSSGTGIQRRKRFTQVKMVDGKLEALVRAVLQNQGKQLELLEKINEIRGMLIDLVT